MMHTESKSWTTRTTSCHLTLVQCNSLQQDVRYGDQGRGPEEAICISVVAKQVFSQLYHP